MSNVGRWVKRQLPLSRQARIAGALVPPERRFRFALLASVLQGRVVAGLGGNGRLSEALMRDHWLRELTFHGGFPIPWRIQGRDVLEHYAALGPVLYCSTHLPLTEVQLRVLLDLGYVPVPLADPGRMNGDRYVVPGIAEPIPALAVNFHVLARMRSLLRQGTSVVCLADSEFAGPLSPKALRLAGRMGVPVIFSWAELAADHVIEVTFRPAPHPLCRNEQEIAENLEFLYGITSRILGTLGVPPPPRVAPEAEAIPASPSPAEAPSAHGESSEVA